MPAPPSPRSAASAARTPPRGPAPGRSRHAGCERKALRLRARRPASPRASPSASSPETWGCPPSSLPLDTVIFQSGVELRQTDFGSTLTMINDIPTSPDGSACAFRRAPTHITRRRSRCSGRRRETGNSFSRNPTRSATRPLPSRRASTRAGDGYRCRSARGPYRPHRLRGPPVSRRSSAPRSARRAHPPGRKAADDDGDQADGRRGRDPGGERLRPPVEFGVDFDLFSLACPDAQFQAGALPQTSWSGRRCASSPLLTVPPRGPVAILSENRATRPRGWVWTCAGEGCSWKN